MLDYTASLEIYIWFKNLLLVFCPIFGSEQPRCDSSCGSLRCAHFAGGSDKAMESEIRQTTFTHLIPVSVALLKLVGLKTCQYLKVG